MNRSKRMKEFDHQNKHAPFFSPSASNLPRGGLLDLLRNLGTAHFAREEHGHTFDQAPHGILRVWANKVRPIRGPVISSSCPHPLLL